MRQQRFELTNYVIGSEMIVNAVRFLLHNILRSVGLAPVISRGIIYLGDRRGRYVLLIPQTGQEAINRSEARMGTRGRYTQRKVVSLIGY